MDLYVILRRSGWSSGEELEQAAARSTKVGNEEMADDVRWIRSYVLDEGGGSVGTVCIYELDATGVTTPDYDDLQAVSLTRGFLAAPERYLMAIDSDALEEDT